MIREEHVGEFLRRACDGEVCPSCDRWFGGTTLINRLIDSYLFDDGEDEESCSVLLCNHQDAGCLIGRLVHRLSHNADGCRDMLASIELTKVA
jgi:hypothetical protein